MTSPMQLDPNTPHWVQHLAMEVEDGVALETAAQRLRDYGVEVIGPIDHSIFQSIYFHDPDGHSVEFIALLDEPPDASFVGSLSEWQKRTDSSR